MPNSGFSKGYLNKLEHICVAMYHQELVVFFDMWVKFNIQKTLLISDGNYLA